MQTQDDLPSWLKPLVDAAGWSSKASQRVEAYINQALEAQPDRPEIIEQLQEAKASIRPRDARKAIETVKAIVNAQQTVPDSPPKKTKRKAPGRKQNPRKVQKREPEGGLTVPNAEVAPPLTINTPLWERTSVSGIRVQIHREWDRIVGRRTSARSVPSTIVGHVGPFDERRPASEHDLNKRSVNAQRAHEKKLLAELINRKWIHACKDQLEMKFNGQHFVLDTHLDGTVTYQDHDFQSLSHASLELKRAVDPSIAEDDGWESFHHYSKPLRAIRDGYLQWKANPDSQDEKTAMFTAFELVTPTEMGLPEPAADAGIVGPKPGRPSTASAKLRGAAAASSGQESIVASSSTEIALVPVGPPRPRSKGVPTWWSRAFLRWCQRCADSLPVTASPSVKYVPTRDVSGALRGATATVVFQPLLQQTADWSELNMQSPHHQWALQLRPSVQPAGESADGAASTEPGQSANPVSGNGTVLPQSDKAKEARYMNSKQVLTQRRWLQEQDEMALDPLTMVQCGEYVHVNDSAEKVESGENGSGEESCATNTAIAGSGSGGEEPQPTSTSEPHDPTGASAGGAEPMDIDADTTAHNSGAPGTRSGMEADSPNDKADEDDDVMRGEQEALSPRPQRKQRGEVVQLRHSAQEMGLALAEGKRGRPRAGHGPLVQPFTVSIAPQAKLVCDVHAHMAKVEIIGLLAGKYYSADTVRAAHSAGQLPPGASVHPPRGHIEVLRAFPCRAVEIAGDREVNVEMDPVSHLEVTEYIKQQGLHVVGWYHSHPVFVPVPSIRDIQNQKQYQQLYRKPASADAAEAEGVSLGEQHTGCSGGEGHHHGRSVPGVPEGAEIEGEDEPFVGMIVSPYDDRSPDSGAVFNYFNVTPEPDMPMQLEVHDLVCTPTADASNEAEAHEMGTAGECGAQPASAIPPSPESDTDSLDLFVSCLVDVLLTAGSDTFVKPLASLVDQTAVPLRTPRSNEGATSTAGARLMHTLQQRQLLHEAYLSSGLNRAALVQSISAMEDAQAVAEAALRADDGWLTNLEAELPQHLRADWKELCLSVAGATTHEPDTIENTLADAAIEARLLALALQGTVGSSENYPAATAATAQVTALSGAAAPRNGLVHSARTANTDVDAQAKKESHTSVGIASTQPSMVTTPAPTSTTAAAQPEASAPPTAVAMRQTTASESQAQRDETMLDSTDDSNRRRSSRAKKPSAAAVAAADMPPDSDEDSSQEGQPEHSQSSAPVRPPASRRPRSTKRSGGSGAAAVAECATTHNGQVPGARIAAVCCMPVAKRALSILPWRALVSVTRTLFFLRTVDKLLQKWSGRLPAVESLIVQIADMGEYYRLFCSRALDEGSWRQRSKWQKLSESAFRHITALSASTASSSGFSTAQAFTADVIRLLQAAFASRAGVGVEELHLHHAVRRMKQAMSVHSAWDDQSAKSAFQPSSWKAAARVPADPSDQADSGNVTPTVGSNTAANLTSKVAPSTDAVKQESTKEGTPQAAPTETALNPRQLRAAFAMRAELTSASNSALDASGRDGALALFAVSPPEELPRANDSNNLTGQADESEDETASISSSRSRSSRKRRASGRRIGRGRGRGRGRGHSRSITSTPDTAAVAQASGGAEHLNGTVTAATSTSGTSTSGTSTSVVAAVGHAASRVAKGVSSAAATATSAASSLGGSSQVVSRPAHGLLVSQVQPASTMGPRGGTYPVPRMLNGSPYLHMGMSGTTGMSSSHNYLVTSQPIQLNRYSHMPPPHQVYPPYARGTAAHTFSTGAASAMYSSSTPAGGLPSQGAPAWTPMSAHHGPGATTPYASSVMPPGRVGMGYTSMVPTPVVGGRPITQVWPAPQRTAVAQPPTASMPHLTPTSLPTVAPMAQPAASASIRNVATAAATTTPIAAVMPPVQAHPTASAVVSTAAQVAGGPVAGPGPKPGDAAPPQAQ